MNSAALVKHGHPRLGVSLYKQAQLWLWLLTIRNNGWRGPPVVCPTRDVRVTIKFQVIPIIQNIKWGADQQSWCKIRKAIQNRCSHSSNSQHVFESTVYFLHSGEGKTSRTPYPGVSAPKRRRSSWLSDHLNLLQWSVVNRQSWLFVWKFFWKFKKKTKETGTLLGEVCLFFLSLNQKFSAPKSG